MKKQLGDLQVMRSDDLEDDDVDEYQDRPPTFFHNLTFANLRELAHVYESIKAEYEIPSDDHETAWLRKNVDLALTVGYFEPWQGPNGEELPAGLYGMFPDSDDYSRFPLFDHPPDNDLTNDDVDDEEDDEDNDDDD